MGEQHRNERYEDGPYDFVPLADSVMLERLLTGTGDAKRTGHDAATGCAGTIRGMYTAATPVRVGTGIFELGTSSEEPLIYQPMFRVAGTPAIPGSSLKGAVRSVVEAITASCIQTSASVMRLRSCSIKKDIDPNMAELCPACRIFGAQGFLGRVAFDDARLLEGDTTFADLPALWRPRKEQRKRYYRPDGKPKGRKFYRHGYPETGDIPSEICPASSVFSVRVDFHDLSPAELGLLLIGIGCQTAQDNRPMMHKLGGSKPSCCGSVKFRLKELHVATPAKRWMTTAFDQDSQPGTTEPEQYVLAALNQTWFLHPQYQAVQRILAPADASELRKCGYEPEQSWRR